MTAKLFFQALAKFIAGILLVGGLLFLSAGTFKYWQACSLRGTFCTPR